MRDSTTSRLLIAFASPSKLPVAGLQRLGGVVVETVSVAAFRPAKGYEQGLPLTQLRTLGREHEGPDCSCCLPLPAIIHKPRNRPQATVRRRTFTVLGDLPVRVVAVEQRLPSADRTHLPEVAWKPHPEVFGGGAS